jgi:hypothetical protein
VFYSDLASDDCIGRSPSLAVANWPRVVASTIAAESAKSLGHGLLPAGELEFSVDEVLAKRSASSVVRSPLGSVVRRP